MSHERIGVVVADIATLPLDAIVNAANTGLRGGGGVDGAIHRAAGPDLDEACREIGACPTGEARATPGFRLAARWVIHAVGPVWRGGEHGEDRLLGEAYRAALNLAETLGANDVAFPAISTGVYGFPLERATRIAVATVRAWLDEHILPLRVIFCCYDEATEAVYSAALADGPR